MHAISPELVPISWARCESAAKGATDILTRYRQTFTLARAPYLIVSSPLQPSPTALPDSSS